MCVNYRIRRRQPTQGSCLSHLSLDALHREHDRVSLRTPDLEPDGPLVLVSPSSTLLDGMVRSSKDHRDKQVIEGFSKLSCRTNIRIDLPKITLLLLL